MPPPAPATVSLMRARNILIASMALTFGTFRIFLHTRPDTDLTVGPYNVHHLFTGVLIAAVCGLWAVLSSVSGRLPMLAIAGFGIGLGLALDEWVYLIVTDGSNQAYLRPVSLLSGAAFVCLGCLYTAVVAHRLSR
jgi:hypothetical protein